MDAVELHSEEWIVGVGLLGIRNKTQLNPRRGTGEVVARGDDEGHSLARDGDAGPARCDAEDKRGIESAIRRSLLGGRIEEGNRLGVEAVTLAIVQAGIRQSEDAICPNVSGTIQEEVAAAAAA